MNSRSVWWWMAFLGCHKGYIFYCRAKREGHEERCRSLEAKFERLADLYADFGDIFEENVLKDKKAFSFWLGRRRSLFHDRRSVCLVPNPAEHTRQPATLVLEVPLYKDRADVLAGVKGFLDRYYDGNIFEKRSGVRQPRPALEEVRAPKYTLSTGPDSLTAATTKALRKAVYVAGLRRQNAIAGTKLSLTDMVMTIKRDAKNPFGWSLTEQDERDIVNGVFRKSLFGGSEVTLVRRALKDFDAYVRNTIHGRFPDNS
jgi:hypothetical protein